MRYVTYVEADGDDPLLLLATEGCSSTTMLCLFIASFVQEAKMITIEIAVNDWLIRIDPIYGL